MNTEEPIRNFCVEVPGTSSDDPMKTEVALELSIEHWKENERAETPYDVDMSVGGCALCCLFFDGFCEGCPVKNATGKPLCRDTPYRRAHEAHQAWINFNHRNNKDTAIKVFKEEREFLESLRIEVSK